MSILSKLISPMYFIGPIAKMKWKEEANLLKKTCDPGLYQKRLADEANRVRVLSKFYDVLLDKNENPKFKGNALQLKKAEKKGILDPAKGRLSIAVSGGGLKMISFMAFFQVLREHNIPFYSYAGTSAGALATLFDRIGMDYNTMWNVVNENLLKSLMFCPNFNQIRGLLNGKRIIKFLETALPDGYKMYKDIPGLYTASVAINVWRDGHLKTDLSTFEKIVFSSEFDPTMPISQGIFSSMCLPVFQSLDFPEREFMSIRGRKEVRFSQATGIGDSVYTYIRVLTTKNGRTIDGGYDNNYPVDIPLSLSDQNRDVVISLVGVYPGKVEIPKESLLNKLVHTPIEIGLRDQLLMDQIDYKDANVIFWEIGDDIRNVGLFDFSKIKLMIDAGKKSAEQFLKRIGL